MGIITVLPEVNQAVSATSSSYVYFWLTRYIACMGMDMAQSTIKVANITGNLQVTPFVQFAEVRPDKPRAPGGIPSVTPTVISTNSENIVPASDYAMAAAAAGNTYARFGVGCKVSSGSLGTADVAFQLSFLQLGMLLTPWSGHLVATSTTTIFIPIAAWMPALNVKAFEATIVMSDITGLCAVDLVYRTAAKSTEDPDAWSAGILTAALTANGETNSGERTVSLTGKMWVQPGLMYKLTSGTTPGQVDISVLLGVRQAA